MSALPNMIHKTESGKYYNRARIYSAEQGRFMSADPMGNTAGANMYTYCGNIIWNQIPETGGKSEIFLRDPINNRDPSGMLHDWELAMYNGGGGGYSGGSSSSGSSQTSGGTGGGTGGGTTSNTDTTDGTVDNTGGEGDLNNYMDYGGGGGMSMEEWSTWCRENCIDMCNGDVDCYDDCYGSCVGSQTFEDEKSNVNSIDIDLSGEYNFGFIYVYGMQVGWHLSLSPKATGALALGLGLASLSTGPEPISKVLGAVSLVLSLCSLLDLGLEYYFYYNATNIGYCS